MIVEDGTQVENSNSYVSLLEANLYFQDRTHSSSWENFDDKSKALITASSMLDWSLDWKGEKTSPSQSMEFPRQKLLLDTGDYLDTDIIPKNLKVATFELALASLEKDRAKGFDLAGLDSIQISSLKISTNQQIGLSQAKKIIPDVVKYILGDLINSGIRLVRA